ncbi:MAG: SWIM zinc finger family protein [Bifidobacteriaceae bacterium]|jgi:uncharacterized Zn finger protein|nr:SWIM zinc finger family protein [Bifidobacteriaceae bacterium]
MSGNWSGWYPPPSRPIAVDGGLKARSKRGAIAQTWWSERFIEVLESFHLGARLSRGRNYARRGQVLSLEIAPGVVIASVQGSRRKPYRVRLGLNSFGKADWQRVATALAKDAWYAAKLLSGEMPEDIEELFNSLELPLFPTSAAELSMDCSCPDWSVPCKHIAAVFYLLAEQFDDDPFKILEWRGRDRESLLGSLAAIRTGVAVADQDHAVPPAPLSVSLDSFYVMPAALPRLGAPTGAPDALCDQLPAVDLAVRGRPLVECLRPIYQVLSP